MEDDLLVDTGSKISTNRSKYFPEWFGGDDDKGNDDPTEGIQEDGNGANGSSPKKPSRKRDRKKKP